MSEKSKNLKGLMTNPRTRLTIIVTGVVVGVMVVIGLAMSKRTPPPQSAAQVNLGNAPSIDSTPGVTNNPKYAEAANAAANQQFSQAENVGGSSLPPPVKLEEGVGGSISDGKTKLEGPPKVEEPKPVVQTQVSVAPPPVMQTQVQIPVVQQPQVVPVYQSAQTYQTATNSLLPQTGSRQVEVLLDRWAPTGQNMEFDYTGTGKNMNQNSGNFGNNPNVNIMNGGDPSVNTASNMTISQPQIAMKAGTVMSAILKTGVNTDEPGPILAEVVSGPFKGSTLIGKITGGNNTRGESVALSFDLLNMPNAPKSYTIQAYAINPDTSRTGLATSVDRHYLERFGLLFASSFMQGYGSAMSQSGAVVTQNAFGGTTTSNPTRTSAEITKIALGQVGQNVGQAIGQNANRPITIQVAQGTAIGVLIMQDISLK
jgi:type IV secretory pathway VirB10-like protein